MAGSTLSESDCLDFAQDLYLRFCDDLKAAEPTTALAFASSAVSRSQCMPRPPEKP